MRTLVSLVTTTVLILTINRTVQAARCKKDAVVVGKSCMDKYEASVWTIDPSNSTSLKKLRKLAQKGNAILATLLAIPGIKQVGITTDDYGAGCPGDGAGCTDYFAVSIPGIKPSTWLTQIQAKAVCRNSGKALPDNNTWTDAALGTPDPGTDNGTTECNVGSTLSVADTGSRSACVSDVGAFDMVGNVWEWVAEWMPRSTDCGSWSFGGGDFQCLAGAATNGAPGALLRGGYFRNRTGAGVFAVNADDELSSAFNSVGFRCVR